jgi:uncharacterized protein YndB with AHSA1/START domain
MQHTENTSVKKRSDRASRLIRAKPQKIYEAFMNPVAVAAWRPPQGMGCQIYEFNPHPGGYFRMSFIYQDTQHEVQGKTSTHEDVFHGVFLELAPNRRIVEQIEFESANSAFTGEMKITTTLDEVPGGTKVTFLAENVPHGIEPDDHQKGMNSTLENLAYYTE